MASNRRMYWGYLDTVGRVVIDFRFDHANQFKEGLGLVAVDGKYGFIVKTGKTVIEPQFGEESQPFFDGLAMVQVTNGKCGYIDNGGRFVIEPVFEWGQPFSEGIAIVRVAGKYGYISKDGQYLVKPQYEHAGSYTEGYAGVYQGDRWYYLNKSGEITFGPYGGAGEFRDGVASIWHKGGPALLRHDGTVVPIQGVNWLSEYFSEGRICFSKAEKYGYMDRDGKVVIRPVYDEAATFYRGMAEVKLNGRWGYIDTNGAMVIKPRFDTANFFKDGLAYVEVGGKSCYIDERGNVVLETAYKGGFPFSEGLTPVYKEAR
jgi:WG containing repeat